MTRFHKTQMLQVRTIVTGSDLAQDYRHADLVLKCETSFYDDFRTCNVVIIYMIKKKQKRITRVHAYICLPS